MADVVAMTGERIGRNQVRMAGPGWFGELLECVEDLESRKWILLGFECGAVDDVAKLIEVGRQAHTVSARELLAAGFEVGRRNRGVHDHSR